MFLLLFCTSVAVTAQVSIQLIKEQLPIKEQSRKEKQNKLYEYLTSQELNIQRSFSCSFAGELLPIQKDILSDLKISYPKYDFHIAKMNVYLDPPVKKFDLILISDSASKNVLGHIWGNFWTLPPSESFKSILKGLKSDSKNEAINKVKNLARLLVYPSNNSVGNITIKNKKIKAEIKSGSKVFRLLEIQITKELEFGNLSITDEKGNKVRYFV